MDNLSEYNEAGRDADASAATPTDAEVGEGVGADPRPSVDARAGVAGPHSGAGMRVSTADARPSANSGERLSALAGAGTLASAPARPNADARAGAGAGAARPSAARVLVVDDDPAISSLVASVLEAEGFACAVCPSGHEALCALAAEPFDLVMLDVMMPGMDGFETCRAIRRMTEAPVIFLSARDDETDKVVGLTLGGDDYIVKPFKPRELVARVRARLRNASRASAPPAHIASAAGIEVDTRAHKASLHGMELALTPKEFSILALLVERAGQPVSARELFESVWRERYQTGDANTVMVHIRRLRKKLAEVDSSQVLIETVFGVGYKVVS